MTMNSKTSRIVSPPLVLECVQYPGGALIGILKIREIIGMLPIISVPQTPPFVKGVINLRGKVIPGGGGRTTLSN